MMIEEKEIKTVVANIHAAQQTASQLIDRSPTAFLPRIY